MKDAQLFGTELLFKAKQKSEDFHIRSHYEKLLAFRKNH